MCKPLNRRTFLTTAGAVWAGASLTDCRSALAQGPAGGSEALRRQPAFVAVRQFAELMLAHGRDVYGKTATPLFAGQLNAKTRRIPSGTPADPGVWAGVAAVAGCQPFCQNLLFDLGLLDVLGTLTRLTGDNRFDLARRQYLAYFLKHCRHPQSGYFPWGEHVGYDLVHGAIHHGPYGFYHEAKAVFVPWEQLWEIDAEATRHEIETAFYNHICDEKTFAFNRHADMNGAPNRGRIGPTSLADSAALYQGAWAWLYKKTGERKFRDWAAKMNRRFWKLRSPATGLFATAEDRPEELWYFDVLTYACHLLRIADVLGPQGEELRQQAIAYCESYFGYVYDEHGGGFFDTLNIATGQPVVGPSKHFPKISRPKYLEPWANPPNSCALASVTVMAGSAYAATGNDTIRQMFDQALHLMKIEKRVESQGPIRAGDGAGLLFSLDAAARRSGDAAYTSLSDCLADYLLRANRRDGLFITGLAKEKAYYYNRLGCNDLAAALLAHALCKAGQPELAPPLRNPYGTMPW
jgi:hypothetical protein